MKGLIAVDGGGTKTEIILTDIEGRVLNREKYAGTNLNNISHKEAISILDSGVNYALTVAKNFKVDVVGAFFGIAGGVNGNNQQVIFDYFKSKYFSDVNFSNHGDEINAINVGVKNAPNGIVVIAGTGSNAVVKKDGIVLPNPQLSGWGCMFDNAGSGFDYGREAILASKREINNTGKPTLITSMVEQKLNCKVFDGLKQLYDGGAKFVASFAPIVFDAYRNNDEVAGEIIESQTQNVADIINNAHKVIGVETPAVVGLVGGIFSHERQIIEPLLQQSVDENLVLEFPQEEQIYGALMQAAKNANVYPSEEFLNNFNQTISNPIFQNYNNQLDLLCDNFEEQ